MRQETFIKSVLTIGAATVINIIIGLVTTPIITRIVDPVDYGQFSIFSLYSGLMVMVLCLGMDQAMVRFYYQSDEIAYKRRLILECIFIPLGTTAVFLALMLLLIKSEAVQFEFNWFCTLLLAVNILVELGFRFSSLLVRLNHNNSLFGKIQVLHKVLYVLFALFFLTVLKVGGMQSLAVATVVTAVICLVFSVYSQKEYWNLFGQTINKNELRSLLMFGFPYIFSMGITSLFQSLDKLSLNHYRTYSEVGIYASAMTFVSLLNVIQSSFNTVWAPRSVEHYEKAPDDKGFYLLAFNVMTVLMFCAGIALMLFKDVFALLLGQKYREASYIMPFLIFQPIMYTISETTVGGINFAKKSTLHVYIAAGSCLTNYIGNTILVPRLGGQGAAISTGISYIVFFALRTLLAEKNYGVGFNLRRFAIITLFLIGFAFYNTFVPLNGLSFIFALLCYVVLFICYKGTVTWGIKYVKKRILPK